MSLPYICRESTYRKYKVDDVHKAEHHVRSIQIPIYIGDRNERACDDMMGEHLGMVFATLLDVDHKDLLQPECELD
jgi:hypothetical protein